MAGSDGWDDFDFGDDSFNAPAPAPALRHRDTVVKHGNPKTLERMWCHKCCMCFFRVRGAAQWFFGAFLFTSDADDVIRVFSRYYIDGCIHTWARFQTYWLFIYIYIETELEKLYKSQPWGLSLWLYPSTTPSAVSESSSIPKKQQRTHSPCHCASQVILGTPVAQAVANIQKNEWPNIR